MDAVTHLAPTVGVRAACDFLGVARASFYRQRPVFGPSASSICFREKVHAPSYWPVGNWRAGTPKASWMYLAN